MWQNYFDRKIANNMKSQLYKKWTLKNKAQT